MATEHMRRCSTPLAIWKMRVKTKQVPPHSNWVGYDKGKGKQHVGEEELEPSYVAGGKGIRCSSMENTWQLPKKLNTSDHMTQQLHSCVSTQEK